MHSDTTQLIKSHITVVVPTYNRYKDLERLIHSYMKQIYKNSTLLICDDLGSSEIEKIAKKYMHIEPRIMYHKNTHNLGFTENLRQGILLAQNGIAILMGDDDLFIDPKTLDSFNNAFQQQSIGIAKCGQILFENDHITQASKYNKQQSNVEVYSTPYLAMRHVWRETLAITGVAFKINSITKKLISHSSTLFPQVELACLIGIFYDSAYIQTRLVAVQGYSKEQLHPISYQLGSETTNIVDDWHSIYNRLERVARHHGKQYIGKYDFSKLLAKHLPIFYAHTSITAGRKKTFLIFLRSMHSYPLITIYPPALASLILALLLPKKSLISLMTFLKKIMLKTNISASELKKISDSL